MFSNPSSFIIASTRSLVGLPRAGSARTASCISIGLAVMVPCFHTHPSEPLLKRVAATLYKDQPSLLVSNLNANDIVKAMLIRISRLTSVASRQTQRALRRQSRAPHQPYTTLFQAKGTRKILPQAIIQINRGMVRLYPKELRQYPPKPLCQVAQPREMTMLKKPRMSQVQSLAQTNLPLCWQGSRRWVWRPSCLGRHSKTICVHKL